MLWKLLIDPIGNSISPLLDNGILFYLAINLDIEGAVFLSPFCWTLHYDGAHRIPCSYDSYHHGHGSCKTTVFLFFFSPCSPTKVECEFYWVKSRSCVYKNIPLFSRYLLPWWFVLVIATFIINYSPVSFVSWYIRRIQKRLVYEIVTDFTKWKLL